MHIHKGDNVPQIHEPTERENVKQARNEAKKNCQHHKSNVPTTKLADTNAHAHVQEDEKLCRQRKALKD